MLCLHVRPGSLPVLAPCRCTCRPHAQQESQALQLRLTITAADRALLRDKLADAEQQLASCNALLAAQEAEKQELYDTAYALYDRVAQLLEQQAAAAAEARDLRAQLAAAGGCSTAFAPDGQRRGSAPPAGAAAAAGDAGACSPALLPPRARPADGAAACSSADAAALSAGGSAAGSALPALIKAVNSSRGAADASPHPVSVGLPFADGSRAAADCGMGPLSAASSSGRLDAAGLLGSSGSIGGDGGLLRSRIPLPPCLLQRPAATAGLLRPADVSSGVLLKLGLLATSSRLPGPLPPAGARCLSGRSSCSNARD